MTLLDPFGAFVDRDAAATGGSGSLAGIRVAVKDNIAVAGRKWTAGLPLLASRTADADAACVATFRAAGAAIVGTVATDSAGFGMMTPGVINPVAPERSVGGSSGGSAAAVAGGLADLALGTDTAGSVRVPAACCGLYGLKPTFGLVPVEGVTPLSFSFDHIGWLTRDLDIMERATSVAVGEAARRPAGIRCIGFDPARLSGIEPSIRVAIERTLAWCSAQGIALIEVELPDRVALAEMHGAIVCQEALEIWRAHWPQDSARFSDTARRSLAYAATLEASVVEDARRRLAIARSDITQALESVDVMLGPTIAVAPPKVGSRRVSFCGVEVPVVFALLAETCPFNIAGNPALSLPLPWLGEAGIPVSLQVAARHGEEATLISLARMLARIEAEAS